MEGDKKKSIHLVLIIIVAFGVGAFVYFTHNTPACCRALTAECLACTAEVSLDEYCLRNDVKGCPGFGMRTEWETYKSHMLDVTFQYPQGWNVSEDVDALPPTITISSITKEDTYNPGMPPSANEVKVDIFLDWDNIDTTKLLPDWLDETLIAETSIVELPAGKTRRVLFINGELADFNLDFYMVGENDRQVSVRVWPYNTERIDHVYGILSSLTLSEVSKVSAENPCATYFPPWHVHRSYDETYTICDTTIVHNETGNSTHYEKAVSAGWSESFALSRDNRTLYYGAGFYEPMGMTLEEQQQVATAEGYGLRVIDLDTGVDTLLAPLFSSLYDEVVFWNTRRIGSGPGDIALEHSLALMYEQETGKLVVKGLLQNDFDYITEAELVELPMLYQIPMNKPRHVQISDDGTGAFWLVFKRELYNRIPIAGYWDFASGTTEFPTFRAHPFAEEIVWSDEG